MVANCISITFLKSETSCDLYSNIHLIVHLLKKKKLQNLRNPDAPFLSIIHLIYKEIARKRTLLLGYPGGNGI